MTGSGSAVRVGVIYHSAGGHVAELAAHIASGADEVDGVSAYARPIERVDPLSIAEYDGILLGSPTRYGTISAAMKEWLEAGYPLWERDALVGRTGGSFTVSGGVGGDKVLTLQALNHILLMFGCIVVGNPRGQCNTDLFAGAGAKTQQLVKHGRLVSEDECARARAFGCRFGAVTLRLQG